MEKQGEMRDKIRYDKALTIEQMAEETFRDNPELRGKRKMDTLVIARYISSSDEWNYTAERFNYLKDLVDKQYKLLEKNGEVTAKEVSDKIGLKGLTSTLAGFLHNQDYRDVARKTKKKTIRDKRGSNIGNVKLSDEQALKEIIDLYLPRGKKTFDCDLTYGEGLFYKHLSRPKERYDKFPKSKDVLPLEVIEDVNESKGYSSIIIDLPDMIITPSKKQKESEADNQKHTPKPIKQEERKAYRAFNSLNELYKTYYEMIGLAEFHLAPGGILVFKAPDTLIRDNDSEDWGNMWTADYAVDEAITDYGMELLDEIVLVEEEESYSSGTNLGNLTRHGKRFHVYLIFKKPMI